MILSASPPPIERPGRRGGRLAQWCRAPHSWSGRARGRETALHQERGVHMQVKCTKCSEPIALSDVIESSDGRLSHMECQRPRMLTAEERALLFVYCFGHAAAYCLDCDLRFRMAELAADALGSRTNLCPRCRRDLTQSARAH